MASYSMLELPGVLGMEGSSSLHTLTESPIGT